MPRARKHLVCLENTPYYHVVSRCVRRAFLCGIDRESGKSYEHRRDWIENRIRVLSSLFSVELCAYAVMSNHYHLVVRLVPEEVELWTDEEVLDRWTCVFQGPLLVQRYRDGDALTEAEHQTLRDTAAVYRNRLASLSWFMKCLNEPIARQANAEDGCTGHFWEARFQSQPLVSDQALLSAMAYVDLSPVRAAIAKTPEESDHTSIKARLERDSTSSQLATAITALLESGELRRLCTPIRPLAPFAEDDPDTLSATAVSQTLPIHWCDYLQLVEMTGRVSVSGKRGRIDPSLMPVLDRLGLSIDQWLATTTRFRDRYWRGELRLNGS
ncbi:MAG: hypothetical protein AAFM91_14535 [Pseudomonadota bacterium]